VIRAEGSIPSTVIGQAQPAGSKRAFPFRRAGGALGVRVTDDNPRSSDWKQQVALAAREVATGTLLEGPLVLHATFYRPRPKGHFTRTGKLTKAGLAAIAPATKPDLTKLVRAAEDALRRVLWRDDAQVVRQVNEKRWGEPARVEIAVYAWAQNNQPFQGGT
jgi:Holliday junction resolvase RusA-like endonuclease